MPNPKGGGKLKRRSPKRLKAASPEFATSSSWRKDTYQRGSDYASERMSRLTRFSPRSKRRQKDRPKKSLGPAPQLLFKPTT
jgi:hypothetical protein